MILVDYHLHSHVSHDAAGAVLEHARRAEQVGVAELCFTEHLDFYPSEDRLSCATVPTEEQLLDYLREVREAQQHTPVRLRAGLEVDYKPQADRWTREMLGRHDFDFLLGSVHNVGPWPVSGPAERAHAYFQELGAVRGCLDYLEIVEQAVATGLFDSLAHLDLMKRFRSENGALMLKGELLGRIVAILDRMATTGTGIEINGSGLVHDPREAYPSLELLRLARERGVRVLTIGSDSHRPDTVGRNLREVLFLAREAGFNQLYTFEKRVPAAHSF